MRDFDVVVNRPTVWPAVTDPARAATQFLSHLSPPRTFSTERPSSDRSCRTRHDARPTRHCVRSTDIEGLTPTWYGTAGQSMLVFGALGLIALALTRARLGSRTTLRASTHTPADAVRRPNCGTSPRTVLGRIAVKGSTPAQPGEVQHRRQSVNATVP